MVGTFTVLHLANHLAALGGIDAHIRVMTALRHVYRQPAVEAVLLAAVIPLVVSGLSGLRGAWRRPGVARWQAISGGVLGAFLLAHSSAILTARFAWELDTNFYLGASPLLIGWLPVWFVPYYAAGIIAVGVHLGAVAHWRADRSVRRIAMPIAVGAAFVAAALILVAFSGVLFPVDLPHDYAVRFAWAR